MGYGGPKGEGVLEGIIEGHKYSIHHYPRSGPKLTE